MPGSLPVTRIEHGILSDQAHDVAIATNQPRLRREDRPDLSEAGPNCGD